MAGYHNACQLQSRSLESTCCAEYMHAGLTATTNITTMQSILSHPIDFYDLQHWRLQLHLKPNQTCLMSSLRLHLSGKLRFASCLFE